MKGGTMQGEKMKGEKMKGENVRRKVKRKKVKGEKSSKGILITCYFPPEARFLMQSPKHDRL